MILCSAEPRIISCLPTHVINLVINDNSLEILYIFNSILTGLLIIQVLLPLGCAICALVKVEMMSVY